MAKIKMKNSVTVADTFHDFLMAKKAGGLSEKTIATYGQHFSAIGKHLPTDTPIDKLKKTDLEAMIASMRDAGLAANSIKSYTRTLKSFFSWCNTEGITRLNLPLYKAEETVKETYTDEELKALLRKPNTRKCDFPEYRNWVTVNLLLNNGCRAATIRNIKLRDVDLENQVIYLRHTKNKKAQVIPLCEALCGVLREYLKVRGGEMDDYLFPNENGTQLTENGLRCSIASYNRRRGVQKTSIHLFRHTFAKKYLVDCGGNAFTLQRLLGHSTLDMTKHYCAIFDADITKNFENFSPLAQLKGQEGKIKMGA
ncbi:MAG: tyrosine-type recombinase/integrase [Clostridiales bacterium]|uniref:tyrosine-type recombinase/integrase n=1 Tax=Flavonifractor porci TaxID=3133422 RepID=UPI0030A37818|nr:tyrosine-type recombinase/integrase [Clostridiales bacterium]